MKTKNITFSLPVEYVAKLRCYAKDKHIPSMNAGVKKALDGLFYQIEKEKLGASMEKAANDPMFMNDISETMEAYKNADSEVTGGNEEW